MYCILWHKMVKAHFTWMYIVRWRFSSYCTLNIFATSAFSSVNLYEQANEISLSLCCAVLCHRWASYSVCFLADTFDFCFLCFDFVWSSLRFLCVHVVVCLVAKILFYQIENQWKHIVFCVGYCLFLFDSVWFYCFFSIWHFRGWWCIWQHHIRNNLAETCVELATKILSIIPW